MRMEMTRVELGKAKNGSIHSVEVEINFPDVREDEELTKKKPTDHRISTFLKAKKKRRATWPGVILPYWSI